MKVASRKKKSNIKKPTVERAKKSRAKSLSTKKPVKRIKISRKKTQAIVLIQPTLNYHEQTKPVIAQSASHTLSPFIIALKTQPEKNTTIQDDPEIQIQINLLKKNASVEKNEAHIDVSGDLVLCEQDVMQQLTHDVLSRHNRSPLSLALPEIKTEIAIQTVAQTLPQKQAFAQEKGRCAKIYSDAFVPLSPPEDIFSCFDFPEELEEALSPEADIIDLDELEQELESPKQSWHSLNKRKWKFPVLNLEHGWHRAVASFVVFSFLFVLPLHAMNMAQNIKSTKTKLEYYGHEAVSLLSGATSEALAQNGTSAGEQFARSEIRFENARKTVNELGAGTRLLLSNLPLTGDSYKTGVSLLKAGEELAIAGERVAQGYEAMEALVNPTPLSRLTWLHTFLPSASLHLQKAFELLETIDEQEIPQDYRSNLQLLTTSLPALLDTVAEFESVYPLAQSILGAEGSKRYLLVFQNNMEIRPTGGFIGSFAEMKVRDGMIEEMHIPGGGSYDLQGTISENFIAPEPLQLLRARWEFQDGNWFPDFPTSARQLMQFYSDAGGGSVDGVLAVNATFVSKLIGLLGPIELNEYGKTINEENFIFEAQRFAELDYDKQENRPKAFIGDLAPKLMERAIEKSSEDFLTVLSFLNEGLSQKDVQFYVKDEPVQREILSRGWGGEIKQTQKDYLMVVNTNLGGGKTDGVIQENIDLMVNIQNDGSIVNTATISRTHLGMQGTLFTGINNVDYMRLYVPEGSTLIEADGFKIPDERLFDRPASDWTWDDDLAYSALTQTRDPVSGTVITQEFGKTVFGNWVLTSPGTTSTVTFTYRLPFTIETLRQKPGIAASLKSIVGLPLIHEYALTLQKQSGVIDRTTQVNIVPPSDTRILWKSHEQSALSNETDQLFAVLME